MTRGRRSRIALHALAFGSGFGVMTIEIAGARLMAPAYGLSAVPWTATIGVILTALAAGNHVGGRLADRGRPALGWILAVAGFSAAVPLLLSGLPAAALDALGFVPGALASAATLFSLPVFCLGMVVPYLVRASTEGVDEVGRRTGDVSAAATAGSIAGTFATGFLLLPLLPLPLLLGATAGFLLALALLARAVTGGGPDPSLPVLAAAGMVALGAGGSSLPEGVLHREETLHASVQVTERARPDGSVVRELWQNGASSSAEVVGTGRPAHPYLLASLGVAERMRPSPRRVLVLGGGALTFPVALTRALPRATVDVVELDPASTRLAREYFAFGDAEADGRVRVVHGDARGFLRSAEGTYDLIYLDVFDNLVTVPWHLVTVEALELARDRLGPDGLLLANVLSPTAGPGADFLRRLLATAGTVFGAVRAWSVGPGGSPTATGNVLVAAAGRAGAIPPTPLRRVPTRPAGPPLTDARAPVEYLQARVFLDGLRWRSEGP